MKFRFIRRKNISLLPLVLSSILLSLLILLISSIYLHTNIQITQYTQENTTISSFQTDSGVLGKQETNEIQQYTLLPQTSEIENLNTFIGYISTNATKSIYIQNIQRSIDLNGKVLINTNTGVIYLISGTLDDLKAPIQIIVTNTDLKTNEIDRRVMEKEYTKEIEALRSSNSLPEELSDLTPPVISIISPQDGSTTTAESIKVEYQCKECNILYVNSDNQNITYSKDTQSFSISINLKLGENIINFFAEDLSKNKVGASIKVVRKDPCEGVTTCGKCGNPACTVVKKPTTTSPTTSTSGSCPSTSLNNSFLSLINSYRASNGLNTLSFESKLTTTAYLYSKWMNETKIFSHTGEGGSTPWQRCAASGTSCDGENLAMGYTTATSLFNGWKASPGHNANMLGTHTVMGICLVGPYATLVLR